MHRGVTLPLVIMIAKRVMARTPGEVNVPLARGSRAMHSIRRAIPVGMAIAGLLLPAVHAGAAASASADQGSRLVTYRGYSFRVPASWRVVDLAQHRRACVRFDRHAVYLGTPSPSQTCPSRLLGTTEAMLVEPVKLVA